DEDDKREQLYVCVEDEDNTTLLPCEKQQPEAKQHQRQQEAAPHMGSDIKEERERESEREREREGGEERE
ncbi:unnamed protein product, partial [Sphagnum jensenii]